MAEEGMMGVGRSIGDSSDGHLNVGGKMHKFPTDVFRHNLQ